MMTEPATSMDAIARRARSRRSSASTRRSCGGPSSTSSPTPSSTSRATAASSTGTGRRRRSTSGSRTTPTASGVVIDWFRHPLRVPAGSPTPFLPAERRLIEIIVRSLDLRFRGLFDPEVAHRLERFHYALEDLIVTEYLDPPDPYPRPRRARGAAGRRAVDLREPPGLDGGAAARHRPRPGRRPAGSTPRGAPVQRPADGDQGVPPALRRRPDGLPRRSPGRPVRAVDIDRWAEQAQGTEPLDVPCPRLYVSHAKATRTGGHVCLVLTPAQEIKVFAEGTLAFAFSDARWRLLDIPTKFAAWCEAVGQACPRGPGREALPGRAEPERGPPGGPVRRPPRPRRLDPPTDRPDRPDHRGGRRRRPPGPRQPLAPAGQAVAPPRRPGPEPDRPRRHRPRGDRRHRRRRRDRPRRPPADLRRDPADRPRGAQGRPRRRRRPHPRRPGRLVPRPGPQGQRGRLPDHVPRRPAGLGDVSDSGENHPAR